MIALDLVIALLGLIFAGAAGWKLHKGRDPAPPQADDVIKRTNARVAQVRLEGKTEIAKARAGEGVGTLAEEEARAKEAMSRWE